MIQDNLFIKYCEWMDAGNQPPNALVLPPDEFNEFQKYLAELERNESMPLSWIRDMNIFCSKGTTEIKIGILL